MRRAASTRLHALQHAAIPRRAVVRHVYPPAPHLAHGRHFARVEHLPRQNLDVYDKESTALSVDTPGGSSDGPPPDERTAKLGRTVRILHGRLPTLLASPLPQEIMSPQISLHLFPSTHPHLPTVSGRIPYTGALWTAPVAWGRLPVVGNVKLVIVSERMVRNGGTAVAQNCRDEKLIVKWKTCTKSEGRAGTLYRGIGATEQLQKLTSFLGGDSANAEFCGLFIFEFDDEGRIAKHTIEHAEEGNNYDRMTRVVSVTDWLLGRAPWNRKHEPVPDLAWCRSSAPPPSGRGEARRRRGRNEK